MSDRQQLFRYPRVLSRHRDAALRVEREQYLEHCANQGMVHETLTHLARELLVVVQRLDLARADRLITRQQIETAANSWARFQRRRRRCESLHWSHERFAQVATSWLRLIGRLRLDVPDVPAGEEWIEPYVAYMRDEFGLSAQTIHNSRWHLHKFFGRLAAQNHTLAKATIADVDAFIESLSQQGWCRVSVATSVQMLRGFFAYAEHKGWCATGVGAGMVGPRIFRDEGLPVGPERSDVERLIWGADGIDARDIRDKALLQLLAIYGLRAGEVTRLRREDLVWSKDRLSITRPKQRRIQEYPLLPCAGESILAYLQKVRPRSTYREVFLTLHAPIRRLSPSGLFTMVAGRLHSLDIRSKRYGSHALRHACAGRLVAQGLSLKAIGDHLGHRSAYSTRTYAKVDLAGLREVANFSLRGVL